MKVLRHIGSVAFAFGLFTTVFAGIPWHIMVADDPVVPWWLKVAVFCLLGGILVVLSTLILEQKAQRLSTEDSIHEDTDCTVLLLNSDVLPGREITEVLGLGKDLSAIVRLVLGGELTEYTEMMGSARSTATKRMKAKASEIGANAVINVRYMTTSVVGTAAELLVYGTAVKFSQ